MNSSTNTLRLSLRLIWYVKHVLGFLMMYKSIEQQKHMVTHLMSCSLLVDVVLLITQLIQSIYRPSLLIAYLLNKISIPSTLLTCFLLLFNGFLHLFYSVFHGIRALMAQLDAFLVLKGGNIMSSSSSSISSLLSYPLVSIPINPNFSMKLDDNNYLIC